MIRRMLLLFGLLALLMTGPGVTADEIQSAVAVPCCIRGNCKQLTAHDCRKAGGHVVDSCRKCRR
jgi:hypothetical protein